VTERAGDGPDKSGFSGWAQATAETFGRSFENLFEGGSTALWRSKLLNTKFKEGDIVRSSTAIGELNGRTTAQLTSMAGPSMTAPEFYQRPTRTLTAEEAAQFNREVATELDDVDSAEQLRKFGQEVVDPTTKSGGWIRRKIWLPAVESTALLASMATPQLALATLPMRILSYQNDEYMRLREYLPPEQANRQALLTAVMQGGLDHLELGIFKGFGSRMLPKTFRTMERFALRGPAVGRFLVNAAGTTVAESFVEVVQDHLVPALSQDLLNEDPRFAVEWGPVFVEAAKALPETALGMMLVSMAGGAGQARAQSAYVRELSSSRTAMRLRGYSLKDIAEIQAAPLEQRGAMLAERLPLMAPKGAAREQLLAEVQQLWNEEQGLANAQQQAAMGEAQELSRQGYDLRRSENGWEISQPGGGPIQVGSDEAARHIFNELRMTNSQRQAETLVRMMDTWHDAAPEGVTRETTLTGADARSDGSKIRYSREGQFLYEVSSAKDLEELRQQARMYGEQSGHEAIDVAVNGVNWVGKVAIGAKEMIQRLEINQSPDAAMTFLHEAAEADLRMGLQSGAISQGEIQQAIAGLARAFDPTAARTAEDQAFRERVQRVARGEANETELRETLSELAVADLLGRRRDGSPLPAGSVTTALQEALSTATSEQEVRSLGKVGAFLRAAKEYFRAVFGTVAALKKARREGGAEAFDTLANKLFGEQWSAPGQWQELESTGASRTEEVLAGAFSLRINRQLDTLKENPSFNPEEPIGDRGLKFRNVLDKLRHLAHGFDRQKVSEYIESLRSLPNTELYLNEVGDVVTLHDFAEQFAWLQEKGEPFGLYESGAFDPQKKNIPKTTDQMPKLDDRGTPEEVEQRVLDFMRQNPTVTAPDGSKILIANPQAGSLLTRARHWIGSHAKGDPYKKGGRELRLNKIRSIAAIPSTIKQAQAKAQLGEAFIYLRRYADGSLHTVWTDVEGRVSDHGFVQGGVNTQYTLDPGQKIEGAKVIQDWTSGLAPAPPVNPQADAGVVRTSTPGRQPEDQQGGTPNSPAQSYLNAEGDIVNTPPAPGSIPQVHPSQDEGTANFSLGSAEQVLAHSRRPNGTIVLSADDMVAAHPEHQAARNLTEAQAVYERLQPEAAKARDEAFKLILSRNPSPGDEQVVFTAGGPASGKSTGLFELPQPVLVYDTNLGNPDAAETWIGQVVATGRRAVIRFVNRDFSNAVRANLNRAPKENRLVRAKKIAKAHFDARESIIKLLQRFSDDPRVDIELWHNPEGLLQPMSPKELLALPRPSVDTLIEKAYQISDEFERKHPDARGQEIVSVFRR